MQQKKTGPDSIETTMGERRSNQFSDLPKRPHQRSVDPHQLLGVDRIRLIENNANFIFVTYNREAFIEYRLT